MRRTSLIATTVTTAAFALAGCSDSATSTDANTPASPAGRAYSIDITQITTHTAFDSAGEDFKKTSKDAGIQVKYDERDAQGGQVAATSIASRFASSDLDLVLAVATPSAQTVAQSITKAPVLFTTVTDPMSVQLVNSLETPDLNITGTTGMNPVTDQTSLVKEFALKAKTLDIICSSGEVNSEAQVRLARGAAAKDGLQVVESAVTNSAEAQQAAQDLASKAGAIYVPTGNTAILALASVVQAAEDAKIPLIAGEANLVAQGVLAAYGIGYSRLGYQTGEMAIRILKEGAEPASLPVEAQKDYELMVNTMTLKALGLELPASLKDRAVTIE